VICQDNRIYRRNDNFVSRRIENETVLVPIRNNVGDLDCIFSLNPVGALVWEQLGGVATLEAIRDRIVGAVHAIKHNFERLIWLADLNRLVGAWGADDWTVFRDRARELGQPRLRRFSPACGGFSSACRLLGKRGPACG
jgi:hypothetical protein